MRALVGELWRPAITFCSLPTLLAASRRPPGGVAGVFGERQLLQSTLQSVQNYGTLLEIRSGPKHIGCIVAFRDPGHTYVTSGGALFCCIILAGTPGNAMHVNYLQWIRCAGKQATAYAPSLSTFSQNSSVKKLAPSVPGVSTLQSGMSTVCPQSHTFAPRM